jgi:hypothetical protein
VPALAAAERVLYLGTSGMMGSRDGGGLFRVAINGDAGASLRPVLEGLPAIGSITVTTG